jgi:hypothetical protein
MRVQVPSPAAATLPVEVSAAIIQHTVAIVKANYWVWAVPPPWFANAVDLRLKIK